MVSHPMKTLRLLWHWLLVVPMLFVFFSFVLLSYLFDLGADPGEDD